MFWTKPWSSEYHIKYQLFFDLGQVVLVLEKTSTNIPRQKIILLTDGTTCLEENFLCDDNHCIASSWVCDGDVDCQDGSDEVATRCHNVTCGPQEFMCKGSGR